MEEDSNMSGPSDAELIQSWVDGRSQAAADKLHARYLRKLLGSINLGISPELRGNISAESIANSAFGSLFCRTAEGAFVFDHDQAFWRLLVTIARNKLRRRIRKKHPGTFTAAGIDDEIAAAGLEPSPDDVASLRELLERLTTHLSPRQQEYLALRQLGFNQLEIADRLQVTDRQVRRYAREVEIQARILFQPADIESDVSGQSMEGESQGSATPPTG